MISDMDMITIEMKLKVLEKWEAVKKRTCEKLHSEQEEIAKLMKKTSKLSKRLQLKNVKINEEDFKRFFQEKLTKMPPLRRAYELFHVESDQTNKPLENSIKKEPIMLPDSFVADEDGMVQIGPNGTKIAKKRLSLINWGLNGPTITRKIMMEIFDRKTLSFGSLTGKPSPAFVDMDKPSKSQLDPLKVKDIIHFMTEYTEMTPKEVKCAITTKCADENKMYRQRQKKRLEIALKIKTKKFRKFY
uniref:BEN domain-containing protein n=1 Tax=Glossina brevipalpis TaxID=37001 RepID=A0A1A9WKQ1_9MUSC